MAKYMISGSYTVEGKKGLIKDGGIKRKQIVENLTEIANYRLKFPIKNPNNPSEFPSFNISPINVFFPDNSITFTP